MSGRDPFVELTYVRRSKQAVRRRPPPPRRAQHRRANVFDHAGEDEQLNLAVKMMLEELKTKEKTIPPPPVGPKK
jgi:hypothetical protein